MKQLRIPAFMLHSVDKGHLVELASGFVPETVHVYKVNNVGIIKEEIEYSLSKSKDRFSLSSNALYLPTCLKKDEKVCIKYEKEIKGTEIRIEANSYVNPLRG